MKKFSAILLAFIFTVLMLLLNCVTTRADDLNVQFPAVDCSSTFFQNCQPMVWEGSKTFTICSENFPEQITCTNCCYTLVYYESFCPIPEPGDSLAIAEYHLNIAGIIANGTGDCLSCDKLILEELFTQELMKANYLDTTFLARIYGNHIPTTIPFIRHTNGTCINLDSGLYCGNTCCAEQMTLLINDTTHQYEALTSPILIPDVYISCNTVCPVICNDFPFISSTIISQPLQYSYTPPKYPYLESTFPHVNCGRNLCPKPETWEGPYQFSICLSDILPCAPTGTCCFNLIYYESFCFIERGGHGGPPYDYHLNVAGITIDGEAGCTNNCNKETLENLLTKELMRVKLQDINFMQKWWQEANPRKLISMPFYRHTNAICKNTQTGSPCGQTCCIQKIGIVSESYDPYDYVGIVVFPTDPNSNYYPICNIECTKFCDEFPIINTGIVLCNDIPCNKGVWVEHTKNIPYPEAGEGCFAIVTYQERRIFCEGVTYSDYRIVDIHWEGTSCVQFNPWLFTYNLDKPFIDAIKIIMENYANELSNFSPETPCYDYFRTINLPCWAWTFNNSTGWGIRFCELNGCCWKKYRICNINGVTSIEELSSGTGLYNCMNATHPLYSDTIYYNIGPLPYWDNHCTGLCDLDIIENLPHNNPPIDNNRSILNENSITYESSSNSDITLEVFDILGKLVQTAVYVKEGRKLTVLLSFDKSKQGILLYKLWQDNKVQKTGKIYIVY
jgi:hypothetical protein